MQIHIPNVTQPNIIIFDIEYDSGSLVQIALLILRETEPDMYAIWESFNVYVRQDQPLTPFFTKYTNITDAFLRNNGVGLARAKTSVSQILLDYGEDNTLIVSHGIQGDLKILDEYGIALIGYPNTYCTYENAKKILNTSKKLTLKEIAAHDGYYMFNEHNAFADIWGTLHALCFLKEMEKKDGN